MTAQKAGGGYLWQRPAPLEPETTSTEARDSFAYGTTGTSNGNAPVSRHHLRDYLITFAGLAGFLFVLALMVTAREEGLL